MKRLLPFIIIAAVALVTVGWGAFVLRAKQARIASAAALVAAEASDVKTGTKQPYIRGAADARVTIEEFADFQCPPCAAISHNLHKFEEDYRGQLRVIFRHYPLANHKHARPAGLAAEAAGLQGRFWEMHDLLYQNQSAWSAAPDPVPLFSSYAGILGLDLTRFAADMQKKELNARVAADQARAASLGVTQTPTVFLNNKLLPAPSLNAAAMRALIESALKGESAP